MRWDLLETRACESSIGCWTLGVHAHANIHKCAHNARAQGIITVCVCLGRITHKVVTYTRDPNTHPREQCVYALLYTLCMRTRASLGLLTNSKCA
jgi:hypothetical protein